jgi:HEAT repeat-containing protein 5
VTISVKQLLTYATTSPVAFKEATAKLEVETRELLEVSIRKAVGGSGAGAQAQSQAATKPQISLRSF